MKRVAQLVASLAPILVAGCEAMIPVETELTDSGLKVPTGWSSVSDSPSVRQAWLSDFEQSPLPALVEEAVRVNYDLRAASARVAQARARARIVGAARLPQIDAGVGVSRSGLSTDGGRRLTVDSFDASVGASWELDVWGRLANDTLAATRDADAISADYDAARLSLAAGVAQAWFDAVESELQVALAEETVRNFRDNLEIVSEGFRIGLNDALDVRLERANLAGAESELEASRLERDRAVRGLEVLLGRYPAGELAIAKSLPAIESEVPAGLPAEMLVRRPDVRAAVLRLEATDERLNSARKNRLPDIRLTASGGVSSNELRDLLDFDALVWRIAANLALPIFQGGRLDAERDLARAEVEEVLADYAQVVLVAFREVEVALTAERYLSRQESALRVAARESEEADVLALERYRSGLVGIITWLEARRRAFNAKSTLIAVSNLRLQNRIALYLALGGDFTAAASSVAAASKTRGAMLATTAAPENAGAVSRRP
jgi:NodT family efflux transporter outer membrane factor (OMF) lipoprotein